MNFLSRMNDSWVNGFGNFENPRHVFIMDSQGRPIIKDPAQYLNDKDQILVFNKGKLEEIQTFFDQNISLYNRAESFVFLMVGPDNLCQDAPPIVDEKA